MDSRSLKFTEEQKARPDLIDFSREKQTQSGLNGENNQSHPDASHMKLIKLSFLCLIYLDVLKNYRALFNLRCGSE